MANNDSFSNTNYTDMQCVLSYELICLLQWLVEHNNPQLKSIIKKALDAGLKKEIKKANNHNNFNNLEEIQHNVVDFFKVLESLLVESIHEQTAQKTLVNNLMPTIEHIDTAGCDDATIRSSIERVVTKIENHTKEPAEELLFKELLRRWKPTKNKDGFN